MITIMEERHDELLADSEKLEDAGRKIQTLIEEEASSIYISIQGSLLLSLINSSVSKPKKRARKKDLLFL